MRAQAVLFRPSFLHQEKNGKCLLSHDVEFLGVNKTSARKLYCGVKRSKTMHCGLKGGSPVFGSPNCLCPPFCHPAVFPGLLSASGSGNRSKPLQNDDIQRIFLLLHRKGNEKGAPDEGSFVRIKGLEPPRRKASDPKSDVATNYTISASFPHGVRRAHPRG